MIERFEKKVQLGLIRAVVQIQQEVNQRRQGQFSITAEISRVDTALFSEFLGKNKVLNRINQMWHRIFISHPVPSLLGGRFVFAFFLLFVGRFLLLNLSPI